MSIGLNEEDIDNSFFFNVQACNHRTNYQNRFGFQQINCYTCTKGVHTISVVIEGSEKGLIGENGTEIECSYPLGSYTQFSVSFWAFNKSSQIFEQIATYIPDDTPLINTKGEYLKGRVTLTPITKLSTKAVMTFNQIMCIDDTSYQCQARYIDSNGNQNPISNNTSISVEVPPSKPDGVVVVNIPTDSLVFTTKQMDYRSPSPSTYTEVTSTENETVSASATTEENDTTAFNHSTIQTSGHNTTTVTPLPDNISPNNSYKTTTYSTQQPTIDTVLAEGDTITVVCTGEVGKPPAKHFFQKYANGHRIPLNYTANTTSIVKDSENCSNYRTSDLTFKVTAQDNKAIIKCFVYSPMAGSDMLYVETAPIKVYYQVSMPTIILNRNKTDYVAGEDSSIDLICESDGNPKPNFHWYKENMHEAISESENFTITDLNKSDSGIYTCNVSNTFNGVTYTNAVNVRINVMDKADISTTQSSSTDSSSGADVKEEKKKENFDTVIVVVIVIVLTVVIVIVILIVILAYKKRRSKFSSFKNQSTTIVDSKQKLVTEFRTGDYDCIDLDNDAMKKTTNSYGHEVGDIKEHNYEYLKKQKEEEQKNDSNASTQPAVYAQVNEATKSSKKQITETLELADKKEDNTYAETQEGIYDKAGDRRNKEDENDEHFYTYDNSSNRTFNDDTKLSKQTSHKESYNNEAFEKDDNRKVATVDPTIHSLGGSEDDEQLNPNNHSQIREGDEHITVKDHTDTL